MKYKVFYHFGNELSSKTKVKMGVLIISENDIYLKESNSNIMKLIDIKKTELITILGGGHCIKIYCLDFSVFISVIRFCLFGSFALVNYYKTMEVYKKLESV
jgi:hypothetical protein